MENRRAFGVKHFNLQSLALALVLGLLAMACSGRADAPSENVGVSTGALGGTGVQNDIESAASNTVVELGANQCTGTLITPKIVLTAAHCINGASTSGTVCDKPGNPNPTISIGAAQNETEPGTNHAWTRTPVQNGAATRVTGCVDLPNNETGIDLALVYLNPSEPIISGVNIVRPSFAPMGDQLNVHIGAAGWSSVNPAGNFFRQVGIFTNFNLSLERGDPDDPPGFYWQHDVSANIGLQPGDSGGPLFIARPNGDPNAFAWTRDPIGVAHAIVTNSVTGDVTDTWTDITQDGNTEWVIQNSLDANANCGDDPTNGIHVHCNHSSKWLAQHGKVAAFFWYGEVDYVGNCDPQHDFDCDHWYDEHDNCPFVTNTDQADSNDDGVGDVCPFCPCDPQNDIDKDTVCGPACTQGTPGCPQYCAGQTPYTAHIDNCPFTYNPTQDNCNALSETAHNTTILGDACDPVPCPAIDTDHQSNEVECIPNPPPAQNTTQCVGFSIHDIAAIATVGAHVVATANSSPTPVGYTVSSVPTTAKYCQSRTRDQAGGGDVFDCHMSSVINDAELAEETDGSDPQHPWHGITTQLFGGAHFAPNASYTFDYGVTKGDDKWLYPTDLARWIANTVDPTIPLPVGNPNCVGAAHEEAIASSTCLNGTLWFHGATFVGSDAFFQNTPGGNFVGVHAPQLANSYSDLTVDDNVVGYCPTISSEQQIINQAVANTDGTTTPSPIFVWPAQALGSVRRPFDIRQRPDSEFLTETSIGPAVVQNDGTVLATQNLGGGSINCGGSSIDNELTARFVGGAHWANAVEPNVSIGRHPEFVSFVLSDDATSILDTAVADGGALRSNSTNFCPNCNHGNSFVTAADATTIAPSPRTDFVGFYSRAANAVVVAGGRDSVTNALNHDLWLYDLIANAWQKVTTPTISLGTILDATYSFRDQKFWVLDRSPQRWGFEEIRLVSFDRTGGNFVVNERWPVFAEFQPRFVLALDRDGAILLSVANHRSYAVVRIVSDDAHGATAAHVVDTGTGDLAYRPVVSPVSYSFLLRQRDGSARIVRKAGLSQCDDHHQTDDDRRAVDKLFR